MRVLALFVMELGAIICFTFAGLLAYADKSGWGWFLFMGVVVGVSEVVRKPTDGKKPDART